MNYFGKGMDAERYAKARPYIHPTAVERFHCFAGIDAPLPLALDIGCGTGQSTIVLTSLAKRIIGIDPSADMLRHATRHPDLIYAQSAAEAIPFGRSQFDLISVAQAFHWFEHEAFLPEAYRLLRIPGWVLVYTSWFTGEMKNEPAFGEWFRNDYLGRYPTPPRDRTPITDEMASRYGFVFRGEEDFENEMGMDLDRFVDFQLSTSNIIAAVDAGTASFDDAALWMRASLEPFHEDRQERVYLFTGKIWYLEKTGE